MLGAEGDVGIGSHIKVRGQPEERCLAWDSPVEAGGVQDGVHRCGRGIGNAEFGFAHPDRTRDRPEAEQMSSKEPHSCSDRVDAVLAGRRRGRGVNGWSVH